MSITVRCAVGCHGCDGPELLFVRVVCSQEQYEDGVHYETAAEGISEDLHLDGPFWVTDENDPAGIVMTLCKDWEKTPILTAQE